MDRYIFDSGVGRIIVSSLITIYTRPSTTSHGAGYRHISLQPHAYRYVFLKTDFFPLAEVLMTISLYS